MPRLIFVAKGAMLDDCGECFRVLEELPAQAGGTRDSLALADAGEGSEAFSKHGHGMSR